MTRLLWLVETCVLWLSTPTAGWCGALGWAVGAVPLPW